MRHLLYLPYINQKGEDTSDTRVRRVLSSSPEQTTYDLDTEARKPDFQRMILYVIYYKTYFIKRACEWAGEWERKYNYLPFFMISYYIILTLYL